MVRKAQSAMEFLTTYGWAFIVVLAAIAALAFYSPWDSETLVADRCLFNTDFPCIDSRLVTNVAGTNARADFVIKHSIDTAIDISAVECTFPNGQKSETVNLALPYTAVNPNTQLEVMCERTTDNGGFLEGDKEKVVVSITYNKAIPGAFDHTITGEIVGNINEI